ncbi:hypothetical protein [Desulforhabdus sp. TSK]|uniref:hypothetical protein n=1 Tax=Desulforhabdus sp. TSK TaxID=2925014 RepID=UPI001FC7FDCB|nr:hypothetical protein [Desulforhabdus sp. TSK]GKT07112.1 hypothetical protein DSTSK_04170 [Desulforhabdus sp. TSK]
MATETDSNALAPAQDEFERYYTEKIWDWIPAVFKEEDGLAARPDVLRSIVEILARQAAVARRSIDRLWEDQFIEFCDDWAIPYIGDLVGTRLVHELNRRGRRVDVARTIFYRRRKGTPLVMELLIRDITGWSGVVVESFKQLARARHGLDPEPDAFAGLVTQAPPGGWARLPSAHGAELVDGPFDEFAHTPDFRQPRGKLGRYNIPKLNFHLYRLLPFEVNFATAANFGDNRFTFDPSGRDVPLFSPDQRTDPERCHAVREWELPAPIPCRLLGAASYVITDALLDDLMEGGLPQDAAEELSRYLGVVFRDEVRLRVTLESLTHSAAILVMFDRILAGAITEDSPKAHLIPSTIQSDPRAVAVAVGADRDSIPVEHQRIAAGNLEDWGTSLGTLPPEKTLVIDPERGRFWFPSDPGGQVWVPAYHYGFSGNIGAGPYDKRDALVSGTVTDLPDGDPGDPGPVAMSLPVPPLTGVFQLGNSKTYRPDGDINGIDKLTLQAANFERPYVERLTPAGTEWVFRAEPKAAVPPGESEPEENLRHLALTGLWVGIEEDGAAPGPEPCPPIAAALVLEGVFDRVVISHCTLDPGGEKARTDPGQCRAIPYVRLLVRGNVEELVIESSIVGPILEDEAAGNPGAIQKLFVHDSIVQSIDAACPAIETDLGEVELERATVFGDVEVNRLFASEALIQGVVKVTDNQHGCFRFSATHDAPDKRLPRQFESHLFEPGIPNHCFVSRRFGDPGYGQLSETAPAELVRGAENRSEIGAFNSLLNPIKLDDLKAKVNEFMPFGLIAQYINET